MCATVVVEDVDPASPSWDRARVALVIGFGLSRTEALKQIRALLIWLGATQAGVGATCWCGEQVAIPSAEFRVPLQRTASGRETIRHAS